MRRCSSNSGEICGLTPVTSKQFHKDLKKAEKQGKEIKILKQIMALLVAEVSLPIENKDHKLTGIYSHHRECHITPDRADYQNMLPFPYCVLTQ